MAARQLKKATKKAAPAARKTPARRAANKPKAATVSAKARVDDRSVATYRHLEALGRVGGL